MRVLALDVTTAACSVALWADGSTIAVRSRVMERGQAEALLPMVAEVMNEAQATGQSLDLIGVTVGPGSFTGIRIGLAAARGMALAWGLPVAGVSTLAAWAAATSSAERAGRIVVAGLETKRDDFWIQTFDSDLAPLTEPRSVAPEDVAALVTAPALIAGDAAARLMPLLATADAIPSQSRADAALVARLAAQSWHAGTVLPPEPLYLRPADVTMPAAS